jgi:hypothetical protein
LQKGGKGLPPKLVPSKKADRKRSLSGDEEKKVKDRQRQAKASAPKKTKTRNPIHEDKFWIGSTPRLGNGISIGIGTTLKVVLSEREADAQREKYKKQFRRAAKDHNVFKGTNKLAIRLCFAEGLKHSSTTLVPFAVCGQNDEPTGMAELHRCFDKDCTSRAVHVEGRLRDEFDGVLTVVEVRKLFVVVSV